MIRQISFIFFFLLNVNITNCEAKQPVDYAFTNEPIDVVIPSIEKDIKILNHCIAGVKKNCKNIGRIIVVSAKKLTDEAEWFDENLYPFTKEQVSIYLIKDRKLGIKFLRERPNWVGWYYQQLLKLYAAYVIPDISSNILIVDSDTIFLNPVEFLNKENAGMYCPWESKIIESYFVHARKLIPGFKRPYPKYTGIAHHMLFQKCVLDDLFKTVTDYYKKDFWKVFCLCVHPRHICTQGASEYEIYFNFLFSRSRKPTIRILKHIDSLVDRASFAKVKEYETKGFHYGSFHSVKRE